MAPHSRQQELYNYIYVLGNKNKMNSMMKKFCKQSQLTGYAKLCEASLMHQSLNLIPAREIWNAHLRRRRQSNLKYGQGLQEEAPNFYII